jgi:septation ring formation regulator EzrA
LGLDPARTALISGFVGTYLRLNKQEEAKFNEGLEELGMNEKKELPMIRTDWEINAEQRTLLQVTLTLLPQRIGKLSEEVENRIRELELAQLEQLTLNLLTFARFGTA